MSMTTISTYIAYTIRLLSNSGCPTTGMSAKTGIFTCGSEKVTLLFGLFSISAS